jgi:hypothetical protein
MPRLPCPADDHLFVYRDVNGEITLRSVSDSDYDETYLYGWCSLRNDERNFRRDRILEVIVEGDGQLELAYHRKAAARATGESYGTERRVRSQQRLSFFDQLVQDVRRIVFWIVAIIGIVTLLITAAAVYVAIKDQR